MEMEKRENESGRNIVYILIDQLRHDALGCAGNPIVHTPHIDALAAEGIRYSSMVTQSPVCVPARTSILSGRYPFQHRVVGNNYTMPQEEFSYAEALNRNNYVTMAIGRTHSIHNGFLPVFVPIQGAFEVNPQKYHYGNSLYFVDKVIESCDVALDERITDTACDYLEDMAWQQPFCMQIGFLAPHDPYSLPPRYASMYNPEEMPVPVGEPDPSSIPPLLADKFQQGAALTAQEYQVALACYYGLITMIDDCIGKLIAKLKSLGLYDNTLIVLTSDHGEMIGDKWMFGKGVPYEASVRVPCIIRDTDRYRGGKVHEGLVEHIDITASLLEYAGLTPPPQVAGRSLPVDTEQAGKDYVFSEMPHWKMIRTESYKLVQYNDGYVELFDLKSDPDETTNLHGAQESQSLAMELTRMLLLHYAQFQDRAEWTMTVRKQDDRLHYHN